MKFMNISSYTLRALGFFVVFLFGIIIYPVDATQSAHQVLISQTGRSIQVDGILVEWQQAAAETIDADVPLIYDALNSPVGPCGYLAMRTTDTTQQFQVTIHLSVRDSLKQIMITDTIGRLDKQYASCQIQVSEKGKSQIIEWCIPYDSLNQTEKGFYPVTISVVSQASQKGTTINYLFKGIGPQNQQSIMTPKIKSQLLTIGTLLIAFLWLRLRLLRKKR